MTYKTDKAVGLDIAAGHLLHLLGTADGDIAGVDFIVIRDGIGDGVAEDHHALLVASFAAARLKGPDLIPEVDLYRADPYLIARALTSLDILSGGRAGLLPLGVPKGVADIGYASSSTDAALVTEFIAVLSKLWNSWGKGALARRWDENLYLERSELRETNHRGEFFAVRGPLPTPRAVQERPLILGTDHPAHVGLDTAGTVAARKPTTGRWVEQVARGMAPSADADASLIAVPDDIRDWQGLGAFVAQLQENAHV